MIFQAEDKADPLTAWIRSPMYITSVSVCTCTYKYEPSVFAEMVVSSERDDLGHHYTISSHTNSINFVNVLS